MPQQLVAGAHERLGQAAFNVAERHAAGGVFQPAQKVWPLQGEVQDAADALWRFDLAMAGVGRAGDEGGGGAQAQQRLQEGGLEHVAERDGVQARILLADIGEVRVELRAHGADLHGGKGAVRRQQIGLGGGHACSF